MARVQPTLPIELYRLILEYFTEPGALFPLLLVSSAINRETERLLYRSILIRGQFRGDDGAKRLFLLQHLAFCTRVASIVHQFSHLLDTGWERGPTGRNWFLIRNAVQSMVNLKHIVLGYSLSITKLSPVEDDEFLLDGCSSQLISLRCRGLDAAHHHLLFTQNQLEDLVFTGIVGGFSPNEQSLPRLRVIGCIERDVSHLARCLPHIDTLEWTGGSPPKTREGDVFLHVKRLNAHFVSTGELLPPVLRLFPSLVYLKLTATKLRQAAFLAGRLRALELPYVKTLYIEDQAGGASTTQPFDRIFTSFPLLETIVLQSHIVCLEHRRGEQDPCDVTPTPDEWKRRWTGSRS